MPTLRRLDAFLAEVDPPLDPLVNELLNRGERVMLVGPAKAGKSTMRGGLIRSLVDGTPFLGVFPANPVRRVALVDLELSERQLRKWFHDHTIVNAERVALAALRGRASSFNVIDPELRAHWVEQMFGADVLIVDCLGPLMRSAGLDPNKEAGMMLDALDALMVEANIGAIVLLHHMGHAGERSRGDSVLLDWPDSTWKIVRESPDDDESPRYFSAFGRDVDVSEGRLDYDSATRALTLSGVNRRESRAQQRRADLEPDVLGYVASHPGESKRTIRDGVDGRGEDIGAALDGLVRSGVIEQRPRAGKGGGFAFFASGSGTTSEPVPVLNATGSRPYKDGTSSGHSSVGADI